MSLKKSVMISDSAVAAIQARSRSDVGIGWSQSINKAITDLKTLCRVMLPELTENEWVMILNVHNGSFLEGQTFFPLRLASDVMDCCGVVDIGDLDEPHQALVRKLHAMSQAEQYAILDMVQKYWAFQPKEPVQFDSHMARIEHLKTK
jgi:hypothetical protein